MSLTPVSFLIVCPMLFLAGFVDAIGGGGGLISLPAYLFAGLPVHQAIATNKLSSSCGTALSTARFLKNGLVNLKLVLPAVAAAFAGSFLGARLSLAVSEDVMKYILLIVLPVTAFVVLNRHLFGDGGGEAKADRRTVTVCILSALVIGVYDGFYGPGTGTFLILIFTHLAKMDLRTAAGNVKLVNLSSCIGALFTSLVNGKVFIALGLIGAVSSVLGHYIGAGLAIKDGSKIVRPVILVVLALLAIKVGSELFV